MSGSGSERETVEKLAEEFAERRRRGERPSLAEYTTKYPWLAQEIRDLFLAMAGFEESCDSVPGSRTLEGCAYIAQPVTTPQQLGEYRILRQVGRGGMGIVYEAVQESLGRHVALKVLPHHGFLEPSHLERFRREARAAARLHHTNIVPVFGVGEQDGIHYYAMQFIEGQGLDEVLREVKQLRQGTNRGMPTDRTPQQDLTAAVARTLLAPTVNENASRLETGIADQGSGIRNKNSQDFSLVPDPQSLIPSPSSHDSPLVSSAHGLYYRRVAEVAAQVADALHYAHKHGVLHRDIKPSNLLLDLEGTVWVTDFGLAKTEGSDELTQAGDIVGTLRYMAPERLHGHADPRSDIYSLGVTLYEMLALSPLFPDVNKARLMEQVRDQTPLPPRKLDRDIPRDLETIVLKAIAKEPESRYATAAELSDDLHRFLGDRAILARRQSLMERAWRWCRRPERVRDAGLVALVSGLVFATGTTSALLLLLLKLELVTPERREDAMYQCLFILLGINIPAVCLGWFTLQRKPWAMWAGGVLALCMLILSVLGFVEFEPVFRFIDGGGLYRAPAARISLYFFASVIALLSGVLYLTALAAYYSNRARADS